MDADLVLLEQWRGGDRRAGEELFARHFAGVFRFFGGKAGARAEDLTQQTFLECVRSRDRFRAESSFRTFLFAIAWNQLRHFLRGEAKNDHLDFDVSSLDHLAAVATSAGGLVDRVRRARALHEALARLPVAQQVVLEYHYWHDLDPAALAEIFGSTPGAIRVRLLRARNALREQLRLLSERGRQPEPYDPITLSLVQSAVEDRQAESLEV
jgi:RNA polymerase sigma-70 factor (ECF subfamily)